MSLRRVFVIVPSLIPTGPVRGAAALCNKLTEQVPVTLVVLKPWRTEGVLLDSRVELLELGNAGSWKRKRDCLIECYRQLGGRPHVASLSFCFSADIFNLTLRRYARIFNSVRGNLPQNYRFDYGGYGRLTACAHIFAMHGFDRVIAISEEIRVQLQRFGLRRVVLIENFIDETMLEPYRLPPSPSKVCRFLFLGSLSPRKRPDVLVDAVAELHRRGLTCTLDLVGDGFLREKLETMIRERKLERYVRVHGQVSNPYFLLQQSDYLVLPSMSEGISRAGLEALFFGIPCVMRDVDSNRTVITPGENGELFRSDAELVEVLARLIAGEGPKQSVSSLIPPAFRQENNVSRYLELLHW